MVHCPLQGKIISAALQQSLPQQVLIGKHKVQSLSHKIVLVDSIEPFSRSSESARYHQKTPVKLPGIVLNDML